MPTINDRIGSQNVIRVLSNASAPPTRLTNLTDIDSTRKTLDGQLLVWNVSDEKFYMTDTIDTDGLIFTAGGSATGITTFSGTVDSTASTNGAIIVSGGLGVAKNLNVGQDFKVVGLATFSNEVDINAAVDILRGLNVSGITSVQSLSIGSTQVISSARELQNITSLDATTTATIEAAIESAPNTFTDLKVTGISTLAGGISGITTFLDSDVKFTGASSGALWDYSGSDLILYDDTRLIIGSNDDFQIWHGGTHTFLKNSGGDLRLRGNKILLKNEDGDEKYLEATNGSSVDLYFNDIKKVATTAEGIDVTGRTETDLLNVSGVSTFAGLIDANARLDVVGGITGDQLNVAIATVSNTATFQSAVYAQSTLDVDGTTDLDVLNVSETATFSALIDANARLDVVGGAKLDQLNVTGVTTIYGPQTTWDHGGLGVLHTITPGGFWITGVVTTTDVNINKGLNVAGVSTFAGGVSLSGGVSLDQLNVTGVSTFAGISTHIGTLHAQTLKVAGVTTFVQDVQFPGAAYNILWDQATSKFKFDDSAQLVFGSASGGDLKLYHASGNSTIKNETGQFRIAGNDLRLQTQDSSEDYLLAVDGGSVSIFFNDLKRLETSGIGVTVTGQLDSTTLNVTGVSTFGDDITVDADIYVADNIRHKGDSDTYIEFTGDRMRFIAGGKALIDATEASTDTVAINDGGNDLDFRVESLNDEYLIFSDGMLEKVGIGVSVPGAKLDVGGTLNVTGVSTFAGLIDANARLDVAGGANIDQLNVAGVSTFAGDVNITGLLTAGAIDGGSY